MGALDDMIAQDDAEQQSELERLIASADAPQHGMTYSEPDPSIPPQPMPAKEPWYSGILAPFSNALPGGALAQSTHNPGLNALVQGFGHGLTAGADQNLPGYGDFAKEERRQAQEGAPGPFAAGDMLGSIANPLSGGSRIGAQVGLGAAQGAIRGFSDAAPGNAAHDTAVDAAVGGAAPLVLSAAGGLTSLVGKGADKSANLLRNMAYGGSSADARRLAAQRGYDYVAENLAKEGEALVPPKLLSPKSAADYGEEFRGIAKGADFGADTAAAQAQAQGAGQFVDQRPIVAGLRAKGDALNPLFPGEAAPHYANADRISNLARTPGAQPIDTVPELLKQRRAFDARVNYDAPSGTDESFAGQANKATADLMRSQLYNAVDQASPAVKDAFRSNMKTSGTAHTIADMAERAGAAQTMPNMPAKASILGTVAHGLGRSYLPDFLATASRGIGNVASGFGDALSQSAGAGAAVSAGGQDAFRNPDPTRASRGQLLGSAAESLLLSNPIAFGKFQNDFRRAADGGDINALLGRLQQDPEFRTQVLPILEQMTTDQASR
jgi:hypothetical protein